MITCPIYQDTYYESIVFEPVDYSIVDSSSNEIIYNGTAYHNPELRIKIKINDICKGYIENTITNQFFSSKKYDYEIPIFELYLEDELKESYQFTFGPQNAVNQPINGHYIAGSEIWYSQYNG